MKSRFASNVVCVGQGEAIGVIHQQGGSDGLCGGASWLQAARQAGAKPERELTRYNERAPVSTGASCLDQESVHLDSADGPGFYLPGIDLQSLLVVLQDCARPQHSLGVCLVT